MAVYSLICADWLSIDNSRVISRMNKSGLIHSHKSMYLLDISSAVSVVILNAFYFLMV